MPWLQTPPIAVGDSDTNGLLAQDLGQLYHYRSGTTSTTTPQAALTCMKLYRLVKSTSATALGAGAALVEGYTSGCRNGTVTTTTVANDPTYAGHVPAEFGSNTIAVSAYFLMQVGGPGKQKFANTEATLVAPTTDTACSFLGTATTAGYVQLLNKTATGTAAATINDIGALMAAGLALTTQSAAVTAAGQLGTTVMVYRP